MTACSGNASAGACTVIRKRSAVFNDSSASGTRARKRSARTVSASARRNCPRPSAFRCIRRIATPASRTCAPTAPSRNCAMRQWELMSAAGRRRDRGGRLLFLWNRFVGNPIAEGPPGFGLIFGPQPLRSPLQGLQQHCPHLCRQPAFEHHRPVLSDVVVQVAMSPGIQCCTRSRQVIRLPSGWHQFRHVLGDERRRTGWELHETERTPPWGGKRLH